MSENMKLWDQVCKTDPAITKYVNQRGGFTAVDAQPQIKRATELWGPYGNKWGVRNLVYDYVVSKDMPVDIFLTAEFYCPVGEFPISSDMAYKPGNDSRKKLLTDVTTKALSKLGFNSDVFEGKYDDNKYVEQMKAEFGGDKGEATGPKKTGKPTRNPARLTLLKPDKGGMLLPKQAWYNEFVKKALKEKAEIYGDELGEFVRYYVRMLQEKAGLEFGIDDEECQEWGLILITMVQEKIPKHLKEYRKTREVPTE